MRDWNWIFKINYAFEISPTHKKNDAVGGSDKRYPPLNVMLNLF